MRHLTIALLACIVLGLGVASDSADAATFTVKVVSGTAGGSPITGAEVLVSIYEKGTEVDNQAAIVKADGMASFEVKTGVGFVAVAKAKHNDMMFGGGQVELRPGKEFFTAAVMVYDVSQDNSVLSVGQHHFIIKVQLDTIVVEEYIQIVNPTDKAVSAAKKDSEGFPVVFQALLPKGYRDLQSMQYFQMQALVQTDQGFHDIMAVPPGKYDTSFSYKLDVDSAKLNFVRTVSNPTSNVVLVVQLGGTRIDGLGQPQSTVTIDAPGDSNYYVLNQKFQPGQAIQFTISGLKTKTQDWNLILFSVIFSILALAVLYRIRPKK